MSTDIARRDLFRGRFRPMPDLFRPPYAVDEQRFLSLCNRCGDCIGACPERVIAADDQGFPVLAFNEGACTFCGDCLAACDTGAFDRRRARAWRAVAEVRASCLAVNGIVCRSCGDNCEAGAIRFRLLTEGRSLPLVDKTACTGCGACVGVCPNGSVVMMMQGDAAEEEGGKQA